MQNTGKSGKLETIELLRVLAAFAVAWFHFTNGNIYLLNEGLLKSSGKYGWLGVEVFFVISGFVIPYSLWVSNFKFKYHWYKFLIKRFLRLYPAYIVTIIVSICLLCAYSIFKGTTPNIDITNLILHLGYLNGIFNQPWINPAFWTLSIEFQYYLLIMFIYPLLSALKPENNIIALLLICITPFLFISQTNLIFHWLFLHIFGILTFQVYTHKINKIEYYFLSCLVTILSSACMGISITMAGLSTSLFIAFITIPQIKFVSVLSNLSYSFYLIHGPIGGIIVNIGLRYLAKEIHLQLITLTTAMIASIMAATLMYRYIEKPSLKWYKLIKYND